MLLPWWSWLVAGLVLMLAELLATSGFFLFFFGAGAVLTGVLVWMASGTGLADSFVLQGILFLGLSLFLIAVLRKPLLARVHFRNQHPPVNSLVGQTARAMEAIAPHETGKVEMHGTSWSALNTSEASLAHGSLCRVQNVQGLTLHVHPQER